MPNEMPQRAAANMRNNDLLLNRVVGAGLSVVVLPSRIAPEKQDLTANS